MSFAWIAFGIAFVIAAFLAPVVARVAERVNLLDRPDGQRKLHSKPIPLVGGPVVFLTCLLASGICLAFWPQLLQSTTDDLRFVICLTAASLVIVGVGIADDRFGLRGRQKLAGQVVAALLMIPSGIVIDQAKIFGFPIAFGDFAAVITVFWILGAVNALNLIDGVDGLAGTTGLILSLSVAAATYIYGGRPDGMLISMVLAGSLAGFLIYNFPPARMFLGDSGSMLVGLILGCVALKCSLKQYTAAALMLPTAIWAIPIFDVCMAIVRRKLTGRSIYQTDRGHLHHCLIRRGFGAWSMLGFVASLCAITGVAAVAGAAAGNDLITLAGVITALLLLVVTRSFGHTELLLLKNRTANFAGSLFRRTVSPQQSEILQNDQVQLNGNAAWYELWETLTDFADRFEMDRIELMVNLPRIGEEYHAVWKRRTKTEQHEAWKSEIPLVVEGMRVGYIRVAGAYEGESICSWMGDLIGGLRSFELQLIELIRELRAAHGVESPVESEPATSDSSGPFRLPAPAV